MTAESKALTIVPRSIDEVRSLAVLFAKSTLLPPELRGKEADVFVTLMAGAELGIPPMAALRSIYVVKGKPVLSADLMVGVVLSSGIAEYFVCVEESATSVTYETRRRGAAEPQSCTWTLEDAQRAQLVTDNSTWKKYPRAMLKARCKAALARDVYPDVLAGCYDEDEARDFAPDPAPVLRSVPAEPAAPMAAVIDAEFRDVPPAAPPPQREVSYRSMTSAARNLEELYQLAPQFNALPKGSDARRDAMDAFYARRAELAAAAVAEVVQP